jgi:hypothetical protein
MAIVDDAVVHIVFSDLMEEGIDEERAACNAEC